VTDRSSIEAIVLTGGLAQRLDGAVKGEIDIGCGPILTGELDAVRRAGIDRAVVVGPGPIHVPDGLEVLVTREDPPFGGPTAAVAAAMPFVHSDWVLVLACDLPGSATLVSLLTRAWDELADEPGAPDEGAIVVDRAGHPQWLAGIYSRAAMERELDRTRAEAGADRPNRGAPIGRVLGGLDLRRIADHDEASHDVDTPEDLAWWRDRRPGQHQPHEERPNDDE
jgi:molybdopterin-guanine dinucleotide biosynthesis protein A